MASRQARAPIVMAAVDFSLESASLAEVLRETAGRIMKSAPGARLACVTVIKFSQPGIDSPRDELGRNLHVRRLVDLRAWASGLGLAPDQVTAHVLEAGDPAAALIDFARENHVEQLVIGAASPRRRDIGPVAARIAAQAPCTVTLARPPGRAGLAPVGEQVETEPDSGFGV